MLTKIAIATMWRRKWGARPVLSTCTCRGCGGEVIGCDRGRGL